MIGGGRSRGGDGGWTPDPDPIFDAIDDTWERVQDVVAPIWSWIERIVDTLTWVLERVRVLYPVRFYRWVTAGDERTCPECGPLAGREWEEGAAAAPAPPLHVNCRCRVVLARIEYRTRFVDDWRLRWVERSVWEWTITGWA